MLKPGGKVENLSSEAVKLLGFLRSARSAKEFDALLDAQVTPDKVKARAELLEAGVIERTADARERVKAKTVRCRDADPFAHRQAAAGGQCPTGIWYNRGKGALLYMWRLLCGDDKSCQARHHRAL